MVFPKFVSFWVGFLAFLWPKVAKNYGVPKIRVFLGGVFGVSLAQSAKESWRFQNSCLSGSDFWHFSGPKCRRIMAFPKFMSFWVGFLAFLWPKVRKNHGIPKIRVLLHLETLEFCVVGELSCWGCELEIEC